MQSAAEQLAALPESDRAAFAASLTGAEAEALLYDWRGFLARPEQVAPAGDWDIWLALAGRGWGKTRSGAEWVREEVSANRAGRIALVAETAADARDVMVAELLRIYPPGESPLYTKSNRCIEFANGAKAYTYNATEPDQLRGPQHDLAWADEVCKWKYARETWDMLQFGLRLGSHPRQLVTTTPRPIELLKAIVAGEEGRVAITRGSTMDNRANLAASFMERIQRRYAGTRLGRQELEAEILGDTPGALWRQSDLDMYRISKPPGLGRVVVAIDPATTEDGDEHGIVVCAITADGDGVVLEDGSLNGSPREWAGAAIRLYEKYNADAVVAEVNQGGDMVEHTIRTVKATANVIKVHASRGKHIRAEPVASLYEQGRVRHVGQFPELETQMTMMTSSGYQGERSPDRLDAMVWGFTELFPDIAEPIAASTPNRRRHRGKSWMGA